MASSSCLYAASIDEEFRLPLPLPLLQIKRERQIEAQQFALVFCCGMYRGGAQVGAIAVAVAAAHRNGHTIGIGHCNRLCHPLNTPCGQINDVSLLGLTRCCLHCCSCCWPAS